MRHDAWRHDLSAYALRGSLQPRFSDLDRWQHLNNTALISMHGEVVRQALDGLLGNEAWKTVSPVLACAGSATDFLAEAHYPAPLTWGARVVRIDAQGLRLATALFQHDRCVGLHDATLIGWQDGAPTGFGAATLARLSAAGVDGASDVAVDTVPAPVQGAVPDLAAFPWRTSLSLRFGDIDAHGIAGDTCLARFAEQMRVEFLNQVIAQRRDAIGWMLVAHVALRWMRRHAPGVRWEGGCGVTHVGQRSLAVRGALYESGNCVAVCDSVMVTIDRSGQGNAALSDAARALFDPYRLHVEHGVRS